MSWRACLGVGSDGWCGSCYANLRGRANYKGHAGYRPINRGEVLTMAQWIRREGAAPSGKVMQPSPDEVEWFMEHPALCEHLSLDRWEDGTSRETSTLLVFWDAGAWKVCLNDRSGGRVAFLSGSSPTSLLEALERSLQEDSLDWRAVRKWRRRE